MASNNYYGMELPDVEQELADYYHDCTNCHAYDENGRLHGKMVIEVTYSGFTNEIKVLEASVTKDVYDPMDE